MSLLSILIILSYLIWSCRVIFNWNSIDSINERAVWITLTSFIIFITSSFFMLFMYNKGYLDFLTKPLW